MPRDWVQENPALLAIQIDQFAAALNTPGGLAASGLTGPEFTALLALNTALKASTAAKGVSESAYRASVDTETLNTSNAAAMLRSMGRAANNNRAMTNALREAATLTVRDTEPSPGIIPLVEDLSVIGRPNGINELSWGSIPGTRGVIWEIEMSLGSSGNWSVIGATSKRQFKHTGAGAGVHRLYRIVARRGDLRGDPGNEAAVYSG